MSKIKLPLFALILSASLIISALFFTNRLDQDFFSYYYTGRGITYGQDYFRDFAENKGPINGYVIALLYLFFGNHFRLGLFLTSGIVDAVSVLLIYQIIKHFYPLSSSKTRFTFLLITLPLYKSFSLGSFMSSFYSESIALFFFFLSMYLLLKKRPLFSGLIFSLSIMSRQNIVFYLPLFILLQKRDYSKHLRYFAGLVFGTIAIILPFIVKNTLSWLYQNMVIFALKYHNSVKNEIVNSLFSVIQVEFRIFFVIFFCLVALIMLIVNKKAKYKLFTTISLIVSFYIILSGGIVYFHHFHFFILPFCLLLAFTLSYYQMLVAPFLLLISLSLGLNYYLNILSFDSPSLLHRQLNNISISRQYVTVVPYYPEIYFYLDKQAPDRYYQHFFILPFFNKSNQKDVLLHQQLSADKLQQTDFIFVINNAFDQQMVNDYLNLFQSSFCLKQAQKTIFGPPQIIVFQSQCQTNVLPESSF